MAKNLEEAAMCGKREEVVSVLKEIQEWRIRWTGCQYAIYPLCEQWDWLIVLQCLQDNGLIKNYPQRPPIRLFVEWLEENDVQLRTLKCTAYDLSKLSRQFGDARYPWLQVYMDDRDMKRWRVLYQQLQKKLQKLQ